MTEIFADYCQPYIPCNMGSLGKAKNMLIVQHKFPLKYDSLKDRMTSSYLDRMRGWDENHVSKCLSKWKFTESNIDYQLRILSSEDVLTFICDLMKEKKQNWEGYRVIGMVGGNGHPYYCFQLFSKHPETKTKLYSGDNAPNVLK